MASVVRDGDWYKLDYAHQLSHGARRMATQIAEPKLNAFREIAENLIVDGELESAHDLVRQAVRLLEQSFDQLIRKAQLVGESVYADEMREDGDFWAKCKREHGQGYRNRIIDLSADWFSEDAHQSSDQRVTNAVRESWNDGVARVRELLMST
jgi:Arc/MetJ-type ribon-helix-helix transcriptional regulator